MSLVVLSSLFRSKPVSCARLLRDISRPGVGVNRLSIVNLGVQLGVSRIHDLNALEPTLPIFGAGSHRSYRMDYQYGLLEIARNEP